MQIAGCLKKRRARVATAKILWIFILTLTFSGSFRLFAQTDRSLPPLQDREIKTSGGASYRYIIGAGVENFVVKLNEAGRAGYRLEKMTKFPMGSSDIPEETIVAAIVRLDRPNLYEYDWFDASTPEMLDTRINERAELGFYFRDTLSFIFNGCGSTEKDPRVERRMKGFDGKIQPLIYYGEIYLVERKNEAAVKNKFYKVLIGREGLGRKPTADLEERLSDTIADGFRPVAATTFSRDIVSSFGKTTAISLLVERDEPEASKRAGAKYQIVRTGKGIDKQINLFARDGFRLAYYGQNWSFMVRDKEPAPPVAYDWLDARQRKSFPAKMAALARNGAAAKMVASVYDGCDFTESRLVFEQPLGNGQKAPEYKTLDLTDKMARRIASDELIDDFISPSKERLEEFKKLLGEGYLIRELFYSDGINVLLEKPQN